MAWPSTSSRSKDWSTEILIDSDLEGQLDILHAYLNDSLNGSTGHGHTGATSDGKKINLTTAVSGTLPLTNGGTGQTTISGLLNLVYPVGSIYMNYTNSTNPGTLLGFGTWTAIEGYALVGYKSGDSNFGTLGVVAAGEKTHTLSAAEMPAHTHTFSPTNATTFNGSGYVPAVDASTPEGSAITTSSAGSGAAHNNIQPSYVVYAWQRTA